MIKRLPILLPLAALLFGLSLPAHASGDTVTVCDDSAEWPPFTYTPRNPAGDKAGAVTGYSVEVIGDILRRADIDFDIRLVPWARCLAETRSGQMQIVLNAYVTPDRLQDYLISKPYLTLTPHFFYDRRKFPDGLGGLTPAELKRYAGCGMRGFVYDQYGIKPGELDQSSSSYDILQRKLMASRCDYFPETIEAIAGFKVIGKDYLADSRLAYIPLPGNARLRAHFLVTRNHPRAYELLKALDTGIDRLEQSGQLKSLMKRYTGR